MLKLISNKIRCKFCGDVIESRSVHDFQRCKCGKCSTDGGLVYAQRSFVTENPEDAYEDLSTYIDENGKIVEAKTADKKDIPLKPISVEVKEVEVPEETEPEDVPIYEKNGLVYETTAPTLDIPEVTEAIEAEPLTEEIVVKRDKNGKPISGRYPYGKK